MAQKQEEVFQMFTEQMKHELNINNHKGDWIPWKDKRDIISELDHHIQKLKDAVENDQIFLIREYSADVANISLFMYNSTL